MLVDASVVEQRYQAVLMVLGGAKVVEVADRSGCPRQSVHHWLAAYRNARLAGLDTKLRRPESLRGGPSRRCVGCAGSIRGAGRAVSCSSSPPRPTSCTSLRQPATRQPAAAYM
jgi:hypothetical protein